MSLQVSKKVEKHTHYVGICPAYSSFIDAVLNIEVLKTEIVDYEKNIAAVTFSVRFDIDSDVYLESTEQFTFADEDDLVNEAEAFLTKFYGE